MRSVGEHTLPARGCGVAPYIRWSPPLGGITLLLLGVAGLKEQLLEQMERDVGEHHGAEAKRETDEQKAGRIVVEELRRRHWSEADLKQRRKTGGMKVAIAARLRAETRRDESSWRGIKYWIDPFPAPLVRLVYGSINRKN